MITFKKPSIHKFITEVFTMQFGQLWDFADGGAETSSGGVEYEYLAPSKATGIYTPQN